MKELLSILKERATGGSASDIDENIYNLAKRISKTASEHLKRVMSIMPEYDLHDGSHSDKVAENIYRLIGDRTSSMPSLDIFLLHSSAYLHDCGMAPAEFELKALTALHSVRTDNLNEATAYIRANKSTIYGRFEGEISTWLFSPNDEESLVRNLADDMLAYQEYRDGFPSEPQKMSDEEICKFNSTTLQDYIRISHHKRIQTYICNAEKFFIDALDGNWARRLVHDLSRICRAHGESPDYLERMDTCVRYFANYTANPQFVAMMLRLGDIIHFSCDRAPSILRSAKRFESDYSYLQWMIKDAGVSYSIQNGQISFSAYCNSPETYFALKEYLEWIDEEVANYHLFRQSWADDYSFILKKVDGTDVTYDSSVFIPMDGKRFVLNQNKIIELLMGQSLYKDPKACIREIYQNSMDAVKCAAARSKSRKNPYHGRIEFGISTDKEGKYLYCLDNGIGMTTNVIENYLLKIGSSYYKSAEFNRSQAKWKSTFTPTSQFGIGLLSCFMLGWKIEISTKSDDDGKLKTFCVDGPHEYVYYTRTSKDVVDLISGSGTLVKVYLKEEFHDISTSHTPNMKLMMLNNSIGFIDIDDIISDDMLKEWERNLYNIISTFVQIVPEGIELSIRRSDGSVQTIHSRPFEVTSQEIQIDNLTRAALIPFSSRMTYYDICTELDKEYFNSSRSYHITVEHDGIEYHSIIQLPIPLEADTGITTYDVDFSPFIDICVDGIAVSEERPDINNLSILHDENVHTLTDNGLINFTGKVRPQLSVDRNSIISYPDEFNKEVSFLIQKYFDKVLDTIETHIKRYDIKDSETMSVLWTYLFSRFKDSSLYIIQKLLTGNLINDRLKTFGKSSEAVFDGRWINKRTPLEKAFVMSKLMLSRNTEIFPDCSIKINSGYWNNLLKTSYSFSGHDMIMPTDADNGVFKEYDLITSLYPLVSAPLYNLIDDDEEFEGIRAKGLYKNSSQIVSIGNQSAKGVHPEMGLYQDKDDIEDRRLPSVLMKFNGGRMDLKPLYDIDADNGVSYFMTAFISPEELTYEEMMQLESIRETNPVYYEGVLNGWSILFTSYANESMVIMPGKHTRKELLSGLSEKFWKDCKEDNICFPDGRNVRSFIDLGDFRIGNSM